MRGHTANGDAAASRTPLDNVMIAMDVVDTLRHDQLIVERELNEDVRKAKLIERLREIYRGQGIDVPDRFSKRACARSKKTASSISRRPTASRPASPAFTSHAVRGDSSSSAGLPPSRRCGLAGTRFTSGRANPSSRPNARN